MLNIPCTHGHTVGRYKNGKCKECNRIAHRDYVNRNKKKIKEINMKYEGSDKGKDAKKNRRLRSVYKITLDSYNEMLTIQGGVCAICLGPPHPTRGLCVDHCHKTNEIRGLLCVPCNAAIGQMRDNPDLLIRAAQYLKDSC